MTQKYKMMCGKTPGYIPNLENWNSEGVFHEYIAISPYIPTYKQAQRHYTKLQPHSKMLRTISFNNRNDGTHKRCMHLECVLYTNVPGKYSCVLKQNMCTCHFAV